MGRQRNQARLNRKNKVYTPRKRLEARIKELEEQIGICHCKPITDEEFDEDLRVLCDMLNSLPDKAFRSYCHTKNWYEDMLDSPYAP